MRLATVAGKIAFEPNHMPEKEGKAEMTTAYIGLRMDKKEKGQEFYPEEKIAIKAWNYMAKRLAGFKQGDYCVVHGKLAKGNDYTNKDGILVAGQWEIHVEAIDNFGTKPKEEDAETTTNAQPPVARTVTPPTQKPVTQQPPTRPATGQMPPKQNLKIQPKTVNNPVGVKKIVKPII